LICGHSFAAAEFDSLPAIYEYRAQDLKSLRVRFARPPRESAPWIYWMWFDNVVSKDEIKREQEDERHACGNPQRTSAAVIRRLWKVSLGRVSRWVAVHTCGSPFAGKLPAASYARAKE